MRLRNVHFVLLLQANEFVKLCLDNGAYHFDTASMSVNYSILLTHSPIDREMWPPLFSFFVICFAFENFLIFLKIWVWSSVQSFSFIGMRQGRVRK